MDIDQQELLKPWKVTDHLYAIIIDILNAIKNNKYIYEIRYNTVTKTHCVDKLYINKITFSKINDSYKIYCNKYHYSNKSGNLANIKAVGINLNSIFDIYPVKIRYKNSDGSISEILGLNSICILNEEIDQVLDYMREHESEFSINND